MLLFSSCGLILIKYHNSYLQVSQNIHGICGLLVQCFSAFLMFQPFNAVPHVVLTANHKVIFVSTSQPQLCYCYEFYCKYLFFPMFLGDAIKMVARPPKGLQ